MNRRQFDDQLKRAGSSVTAIEIDGLQQCIDYLQTLPQIIPDRIGMIGLSYGGFYSMLLAALDTRIQATMTACFFNSSKAHEEFSDCFWFGSQEWFQDAEVAALIYPRKLWIAVGEQDELFSCVTAKQEFERLKQICHNDWSALRFQTFQGKHEFPHDEEGIEFIIRALANNP